MNDENSGGGESMPPLNKRPLSVTLISGLFLLAGVVGFAYHVTEFKKQDLFQYDLFWVLLVRLAAVIGAVFLFRASNWARWFLVIWMAYHVILGGIHSPSSLIVHTLLLGVIAYFLFGRPASLYFRGTKTEPARASRDRP